MPRDFRSRLGILFYAGRQTTVNLYLSDVP
jgi:hypothetical protein